jgi:hypothetical protein
MRRRAGGRRGRKVREIATGRVFDSVESAAQSLGARDGSTLRNAIEGHRPFRGVRFEYVGPVPPAPEPPRSFRERVLAELERMHPMPEATD